MSTVLPPSLADFSGVLSESRRIIHSHARHFLALSVLFLLPLSFSISVFPTVLRCFSSSGQQNLPVHTSLRLPSSSFPSLHHRNILFHLGLPIKTIGFILIFFGSSLIFFVSAAGSLTYSAFHGFYGRPVKLAAALSSLSRSFLPLLATSAAGLLYVMIIAAAYALYEFLAKKGISLVLGAGTHSPYFFAISLFGALISTIVLANLATNWILASATVVNENRWGFDALNRSKDLVGKMKITGMSLIIFFGMTVTYLIRFTLISIDGGVSSAGGGIRWEDWALAVQIVGTSTMLTVMLLYGISAATVFYIYCKAVRGELEDEIASEYVEDKVPILVSVINE